MKTKSKTTEETTVLSVSLRPKSFDEIYGQDTTIKAIRNHISKRPPRVWLFTGAPGTAKTTLARIMSVAYQCGHQKVWGSPCEACYENKTGFGIHEIDAATNSGVEALEAVAKMSYMKPIMGNKRVLIIDECHHISKVGWSSLLKPTEDASQSTIWIFCTSELSKVPAAIQRRATKYVTKQLSIDQVEEFVKKTCEKLGVTQNPAKFIEALHMMQIGAPGVILQALEKFIAGNSPNEAVSGVDGANLDTFKVCKAVTAGDWSSIAKLLLKITSDDVRFIRASVTGWLKGCLLRESSPRGQTRATDSILDLTVIPFDETILVPWLLATLNKICKRYQVN